MLNTSKDIIGLYSAARRVFPDGYHFIRGASLKPIARDLVRTAAGHRDLAPHLDLPSVEKSLRSLLNWQLFEPAERPTFINIGNPELTEVLTGNIPALVSLHEAKPMISMLIEESEKGSDSDTLLSLANNIPAFYVKGPASDLPVGHKNSPSTRHAFFPGFNIPPGKIWIVRPCPDNLIGFHFAVFDTEAEPIKKYALDYGAEGHFSSYLYSAEEKRQFNMLNSPIGGTDPIDCLMEIKRFILQCQQLKYGRKTRVKVPEMEFVLSGPARRIEFLAPNPDKDTRREHPHYRVCIPDLNLQQGIRYRFRTELGKFPNTEIPTMFLNFAPKGTLKRGKTYWYFWTEPYPDFRWVHYSTIYDNGRIVLPKDMAVQTPFDDIENKLVF